MRLALVLLVALVVLLGVGWLLIPVLLAHAPGIGIGFALLLLLVALLIPSKPKCGGLHCPGCRDHQ